jgi:hypothetical protein
VAAFIVARSPVDSDKSVCSHRASYISAAKEIVVRSRRSGEFSRKIADAPRAAVAFDLQPDARARSGVEAT